MVDWPAELARILRYYYTLRYLKPVQFYGRLRHQWYKPRLQSRLPMCLPRVVEGPWVLPAARPPSLLGPSTFRLLNKEGVVSADWNDAAHSKLWLYHLHYFDDLNASDARCRHSWHTELIERWIEGNPLGYGAGWEPYPLSRRIVNWIKWRLGGNPLSSTALASLANQVRWLAPRLETHLLGNHLFANAKALLYAGLFFAGSEAQRWQRTALQVLHHEVAEQILADGGHFERSPMYHAIVLEDMLDLLNLCTAYRSALSNEQYTMVASWYQQIAAMRQWLAAMCHPDGEIAFFNDAAIGMAAAPAELEAYAVRCRLPPLPPREDGVTHLAQSGYLRVQLANCVAILDVAPIGPDYLPGHAHADTLSFELSLHQQRVIVNTGVSCYGLSSERLRQRGTAAHSTVVVNGQDSSEVWGGFRVARRARPFGLSIAVDNDRITVRCAHDGYHRFTGKPTHWRTWEFSNGSLTVHDTIEGGRYEAKAYYHCWPPAVTRGGVGKALCDGLVTLDYERQTAVWIPTTVHQEFGLSEASDCLMLPLSDSGATLTIRW